MVLEHRTRQLHYYSSDLEKHSIEMARFVEMNVRWPWLIDALGTQHDFPGKGSHSLMSQLLEGCNEEARWDEVLGVVGLQPSDADLTALRELLRRPGADLARFARIVEGYL
jgi:hypothetical protein